MKAQSESTIRFSGYPLRIAETKQKQAWVELIVVRSLANPSSFQKNKVTNDPLYWDLNWFANYE